MGFKTLTGRGKYGVTLTHKGVRKLDVCSFNTKEKAKERLKKYLKSKKRQKGVTNPRVIKLKGYKTKSRIR